MVITIMIYLKKKLKNFYRIMNFKKLELIGFKSFFDKTTFFIQEGLDRNSWTKWMWKI